MRGYVVRRLIELIPLFFGITLVSFTIVMAAPGDPLAAMFSPEEMARIPREELLEKMGLNEPIHVQYYKMMQRFFTGDLYSFVERRPVMDVIADCMPTTLIIGGLALLLSVIVGIPLAVLSATRPYSKLDDAAMVGSLVGLSLPSFWVALIMVLLFSEKLRWLPATGIRPVGASGYNLVQMFPYLIMPVCVLSLAVLPSVVRYTRSSMMDVLVQDYVRTARGKGLSERTVLIRHALRNTLIPVITVVATLFPFLLGGSVLVENVFALPGLGRVAVKSAMGRDYPVVLTINMLSAMLVVGFNLLSDIGYGLIDPRIRQG